MDSLTQFPCELVGNCDPRKMFHFAAESEFQENVLLSRLKKGKMADLSRTGRRQNLRLSGLQGSGNHLVHHLHFPAEPGDCLMVRQMEARPGLEHSLRTPASVPFLFVMTFSTVIFPYNLSPEVGLLGVHGDLWESMRTCGNPLPTKVVLQSRCQGPGGLA